MRTPATVARLVTADFPETRFLLATAAAQLLERLDTLGIAGAAVNDARVGSAALTHDLFPRRGPTLGTAHSTFVLLLLN